MKNLAFLMILLCGFSCASYEKREPAAADQEKEERHRQYQGLFDRSF